MNAFCVALGDGKNAKRGWGRGLNPFLPPFLREYENINVPGTADFCKGVKPLKMLNYQKKKSRL